MTAGDPVPVAGSLSGLAYRQLKADIIACRLGPGSLLAAPALAERLSMSRTPVHEALKALGREGLVRVVPRVGYIVTPVAAADIDEIFELRLALEAPGAGLAARRASDDDVARLREHNARGRALEGSGSADDPAFLQSLVASNRAFHVRIAELSGNQRLARIVAELLDEGERIYFLYYRPRPTPPMVDAHEDILRALEARDPAAAGAAMEAHIRDSRNGTRQGASLP